MRWETTKGRPVCESYEEPPLFKQRVITVGAKEPTENPEERVGQSVETTGYHSFSELEPSGVSQLVYFQITGMIRGAASFFTRLLCWFLCCWCRGMASEALPTLNVRMAPPADTWPEISAELRSCREEVLLARKVRCCF